MKDIYLEVTYRHGNPWVAYLYLPRKKGEKSDRCVQVEPDMVLDINAEGKLIGIELVTCASSIAVHVWNQRLTHRWRAGRGADLRREDVAERATLRRHAP